MVSFVCRFSCCFFFLQWNSSARVFCLFYWSHLMILVEIVWHNRTQNIALKSLANHKAHLLLCFSSTFTHFSTSIIDNNKSRTINSGNNLNDRISMPHEIKHWHVLTSFFKLINQKQINFSWKCCDKDRMSMILKNAPPITNFNVQKLDNSNELQVSNCAVELIEKILIELCGFFFDFQFYWNSSILFKCNS